jgi:protein-S-isoprenylcysteine O-methyltransferase Ste14
MSTLKHLQAILALPVMVTLIIPSVILLTTQAVNVGWSLPTPIRPWPLLVGILLTSLGLVLMVKTISLFATIGQGTLAPWAATKKLVVQGIYRHVRNPMISGVFCILVGEALAFGSVPLLVWSGGFAVINSIYIPLIEERGLEQRFGMDYVEYKGHVPRWIPQRTPWQIS